LIESFKPMVYCATTNESDGKLLHCQSSARFLARFEGSMRDPTGDNRRLADQVVQGELAGKRLYFDQGL
jgi:hypothetical protein